MTDLGYPLRIVVLTEPGGNRLGLTPYSAVYRETEWAEAQTDFLAMVKGFPHSDDQRVSLLLVQGMDKVVLREVFRE